VLECSVSNIAHDRLVLFVKENVGKFTNKSQRLSTKCLVREARQHMVDPSISIDTVLDALRATGHNVHVNQMNSTAWTMLKRMGWELGVGIGKHMNGINDPIIQTGQTNRSGLGMPDVKIR
jgi:hypothetical protein